MKKVALWIVVVLLLVAVIAGCGNNNSENGEETDNTAPVISAVTATGSTIIGATVTWTTDEAATSQVEYGQTASYGSATTLDTSRVTSHSVSLSGLSAAATYHYRVKSKDAYGNEAVSGDYTFTTPTSSDTLYAASGVGTSYGPSNLYIVDPTAGGNDVLAGTIQTSVAFKPVISDLALAPDGNLYGISFNELYLIDKDTAIATQIGSGLGVVANALDFDATGNLYGTSTSGTLFRIDTTTGAATTIGQYGSGYKSSGGLAFAPDGHLYATVEGTTDFLVEVNPNTGVATRVDPAITAGYSYVFGLVFIGDHLYGLTSGNGPSHGFLIEIDTATGAGTLVRDLAFNAFGGTNSAP